MRTRLARAGWAAGLHAVDIADRKTMSVITHPDAVAVGVLVVVLVLQLLLLRYGLSGHDLG